MREKAAITAVGYRPLSVQFRRIVTLSTIHYVPSQELFQTTLANGIVNTGTGLRIGNSLGRAITLPGRRAFSVKLAIEEWGRQLRQLFRPTRNRRVHSILSARAAVTQRPVGDVPGFTPRGARQRPALMIATHIDPFDRAISAALPVRSRDTIRRAANNANLIKTPRQKVARHLLKFSLELETLRAMLNTSLPAKRRRDR